MRASFEALHVMEWVDWFIQQHADQPFEWFVISSRTE